MMVMEFAVEVWETNVQLSFIAILHNFIKTDFICYLLHCTFNESLGL